MLICFLLHTATTFSLPVVFVTASSDQIQHRMQPVTSTSNQAKVDVDVEFAIGNDMDIPVYVY